MPSHGIAYDTWAGLVNPGIDDEGFAYIPEHPSIGIHAGPLFGALGILAGVIRARATGEGCRIEIAQSDAAAAMDWYRSETWKAYERPGVGGDRQRVRRLRAPRARAPRACAKACATRSTSRRTATCCSWRRSRSSGRTSARASTAWTCSSGGRARGSPTTRRGNRELQAELRDIFAHADLGRVDRLRRRAQHADRPGEHAEDPGRRPAVPAPAAVASRARRSAPTAADADQADRRGPARADEGPDGRASTPTRCWPRCWATTPSASPPCGRAARSG